MPAWPPPAGSLLYWSDAKMFVEGEVEIKIKDKTALGLDEHETKLWIQRSFKGMTCYRISSFNRQDDKVVRVTVALKISDLPE
ncbi:MAG: hypothetical protein AAF658_22810, partial [Myxococcota bacterium]